MATLAQFLIRKRVAEVNNVIHAEGLQGMTTTDDGKEMPAAAARMQELMRGVRASDLATQHPEWVQEYERAKGNGRVRES